MPLTNVWGELNANVQDAPNDPNNDLQNGYQSSCGGAANPEPLDFYLWELGTLVEANETAIAALGGGGAGTITGGANLGNADVFSAVNGTNLEFRGIDNTDGLLAVTQNATDVVVNANMGNIVADATFLAAVDARVDAVVPPAQFTDGQLAQWDNANQRLVGVANPIDPALFTDGQFAQWNNANQRLEGVTNLYDPSDVTQVGGVYTEFFSSTGTSTVTTLQLPAGGMWSYIITVLGDSQTDNFNITPGGVFGGGGAGNQTIATRAGTEPGNTTFQFNLNENFGADISLFAIRIS